MPDVLAGTRQATAEAPLFSPLMWESDAISSAAAGTTIDYYAPFDLTLVPVELEVIVTIGKAAATNTVRAGTSGDDDSYFTAVTVAAAAAAGTRYSTVNGGLTKGAYLTATSQIGFSGAIPFRITTTIGGTGTYKVRAVFKATGPNSSHLFKASAH